MVFCTKCGTKLSDSSNFCRKCGTRVRKRPSFRTPTRSSTEDFINKAREKLVAYTSPKIESTRTKVISGLDGLTNDIQDPDQYSRLSENNRERIAKSLFNLKAKISRDETGNFAPTESEAQEIVQLSDELIDRLKQDKCLVCLKNLEPEEGKKVKIIVCPECGHGSHEHVRQWFSSKGSCPYCRQKIKIRDLLTLELTA